ncbi:hypothetical protein [Chryseobacterium sp.]|uniref:hypothetical protein n=1 Tax=Chryseobacterium sp. TaxID=1871047 RepID=UPI001B03A841|nr:hypothetical protein [Chryseobacterium sp.]MBO9692924.1 hypothetical protein [Chryseobacterium sp.]
MGSCKNLNHLLRRGTSLSAMAVWLVLFKHKVNPVVKDVKNPITKDAARKFQGIESSLMLLKSGIRLINLQLLMTAQE